MLSARDTLIYLFLIQTSFAFVKADKRISFSTQNKRPKEAHEGAYFNVFVGSGVAGKLIFLLMTNLPLT
jgi:hypothetical protein